MNYYYFLATTTLINVLLATSLNLVLGQAGILSLAHSAFMSVGAYTSAYLLVRHGFNFGPAILLAMVGGAIAGALISLLSTLLPEADHILFYLAVAVLATEVAAHWTSVTGAASGIVGIPRPTVLGQTFATQQSYMYFSAIVVFAVVLLLLRTERSRLGLVARAMREDATACEAAGWRISSLQVVIFAIGSAGAAVAGVLYAGQLQFIQASSFDVSITLTALIYVVVGGMGNICGAAIGAVVLTLLPEALNDLNLDARIQALVNQVIIGCILIGFIRFRRSGVVPERPIVRLRTRWRLNA